MFQVNPNPSFVAPVELSRPDSQAKVPVTFVFKHKGHKAYDAWVASSGAFDSDAAFLHEVIESWGPEFVGPDGEPAPYSLDALAKLLDDYHGTPGKPIFEAYRDGLRDARAKN